ncbi:hypothetical protein [Actinoalloteichus spitiensis]|uniref:hypothetical protein n=1 Tax=Actinoalloteichus spitiensis TaxID=252394 RepID=UPI0002DE3C4B|nr:hypothetical protein [Actinoalloteichus spitiensis]
MQSQTVNRYAKEKYQQIVTGMEEVRIAIEEAERLHRKMREPVHEKFGGWQTPDKEEIKDGIEKAKRDLETFREELKKQEVELLSRDWRI